MLQNLTDPSWGFQSKVAFEEFDCKQIARRLIQVYFYSDKMGNGSLVPFKGHHGPYSWTFDPPESLGEATVMRVCGIN